MLSKLFTLSLLASFCLAAATPPFEKRADTAGYENPADHGGSMQAVYYSGLGVPETYPLNVRSHFYAQLRSEDRSCQYVLYSLQVIVSNVSTPLVLSHNGTMDWLTYAAVVFFSLSSDLLH